MSNYSKTHVATESQRTELHDILALTGAEISINNLPAGAEVPFFHKHRQNEEIYYIVAGKATMELDGEKVALEAGDWLRVAPEASRKLHAETNLTSICIQVKADSLTQWTMTDAEIL